jgi:hypothetical protein
VAVKAPARKIKRNNDDGKRAACTIPTVVSPTPALASPPARLRIATAPASTMQLPCCRVVATMRGRRQEDGGVVKLPTLATGMRVRVTHRIPERDRVAVGQVEGVVESVEARPTGSWYAHGKNDRLWLPRLLLRKDDGERILLNIDPYTAIETLN